MDVSKLNSNIANVLNRIPYTFIGTSLYIKGVSTGSRAYFDLVQSVSGTNNQFFLIIGSSYNNVTVAYISVWYNGSHTLSNLGGAATITANNNRLTVSSTYNKLMIISNYDFTVT